MIDRKTEVKWNKDHQTFDISLLDDSNNGSLSTMSWTGLETEQIVNKINKIKEELFNEKFNKTSKQKISENNRRSNGV